MGANILEFRGVGRHEGPKALISERTPRQTEGRAEDRSTDGRERDRERAEGKKGISKEKSRMQGIPRSLRKKKRTLRKK